MNGLSSEAAARRRAEMLDRMSKDLKLTPAQPMDWRMRPLALDRSMRPA